MFGLVKKETVVLVLRDSDELAEALRVALADATDEDRPGLERAAALVAERSAADDAELRGRWVRAQLADAGWEGPVDSVEAIKALRTAEPGLRLAQAVTLAKEASVAHK
ncbi:hypothetical protein OG883_02850 [Streptomyces sp. NBC_01142]|uniref:hypothetical protein n=1 Tax=Streptomyces sp. NBC_01142 TaxID=2975865 RepID=UPI0022507539|nr:hypothetical protein [Streptomyces sp. NBC_01142]MCX4818857.1 hypothetical protein [Streptomyces sp. NBC_01142]